MKKKSLLIYSLVLILGLSCLGGYHSYAGTALISKGRMEFDNNTPETEDDAIFDVDDLKALDTKISEAEAEINNIETSINNSKQEIVNILNQNPNINIDGEVSFPNIITYIQGSTNVPADTYFYEKGTEGSAAIVRYKKVGGKYYKCDANGKVAQGAQEVNVSGKQLEDYAGTKAGNLSAGAAGYANGGFYLGDGSDNAAYVEQGKQEGINQTKVGTASPGDVLAGKTFTNITGIGISGTMVNRGQLNWSPTASETKTIQPGYYSGGTLSTEAVYKKGLEESIKGDWSLKLSFHIKAGNSSSLLSGSYVRVTLKKGIFETVLYEKDVTTFISTETVTKNLIDYSGYFNSSHKIRIELAFAGHNSGTFMGNVYAKLYFINSNGETLLHTVTTTSTTHDEHKEILIGQYIK